MIEQRIQNQNLKNKIVSAEQAASWIKNEMTLALSGFTRSGDAKAVPLALVERVKQTNEELKVNVYTGASLGSDVDKWMAEAGIVHKRLPFQADKIMRSKINEGEILFVDQHLSHTSEWIRTKVLPEIDIAIIEAVVIKDDGSIIPTTSVGNSPVFVQQAKEIIIELNVSQPLSLNGVHDIYDPGFQDNRLPIPLTLVNQRIGDSSISVDLQKIKGIVITNQLDSPSTILNPDKETFTIANHLLNFLREEVQKGRIPQPLPPLQSGIGTISNAVMSGFLHSEFEDLTVYSEVLQDSVFDLLDAKKVKFASGCSITLSPQMMDSVITNFERYQNKIILRPQEITNNPEIIRRLGLISINTALEIDIYGNVNSTHVMGTKMMNGIGGSGDFARNSRLAIFVTKSLAKDGNISSIVPFVSHVDHTEHDVDIIVTEQGLADLRGMAPRERASLIIKNCAHPKYREQLIDYYQEALTRGGQTPHVLEKAFSWYTRYETQGTMLETK